jgi:Spy/CpxP family protein refolding chaperone
MRRAAFPIAIAMAFACQNKSAGEGSQSKAGENSPAAESARAAPAGSAAVPRGEHRKHRGGRAHFGGPSSALFFAARDLELKPEQKAALDKIDDDQRGPEGDQRGIDMRQVREILASGVKAGKIDPAKLDAHYKTVESAAKARQEREAKALNSLHAALEPAQRKTLVAAVRAKNAKREERLDKPRAKSEDREAKHAQRELERLTNELSLDAAQQKKVETLIAKKPKPDMKATMEAGKKRMDTLLTAFEADTFDAAKLELSDKNWKGALEHRISYLNELSAILKPEQREKLAQSLPEHEGMSKRLGFRGRRGPAPEEKGDTEAPAEEEPENETNPAK